MTTAISISYTQRLPKLQDQTVIVIGGSTGIGFEVARQARAEGATLILTGRDRGLLQRAAHQTEALSTSAFDATDPALLEQFFRGLPAMVDHVLVTADEPCFGRIIDMDYDGRLRALSYHLMLFAEIARNAANKLRPGGTLVFISGTTSSRPAVGIGIVSTVAAALPALTKILALELAPIRVSSISTGVVNSSSSTTFADAKLDDRRRQTGTHVPVRGATTRTDVADLALQIMGDATLTGATYSLDNKLEFSVAS